MEGDLEPEGSRSGKEPTGHGLQRLPAPWLKRHPDFRIYGLGLQLPWNPLGGC